MAESTTIRSASLTAEIAPLGAELQVLRSASGRDYLWDGEIGRASCRERV